MKAFAFDEALSGRPKVIGEIEWVSNSIASVESLAVYSEDEELAIVSTKGPHGLEDGDSIWLVGYEFEIDGKYIVKEHPSKKVDRALSFAIEKPKRLEPNKKLKGGTLRTSKRWSVYHPEHLPLEETTELKKLNLQLVANVKAQVRYMEIMEKTAAFDLKIAALMKRSKVNEDREKEFTQRFQSLAGISEGEIKTNAIASFKKDFGIKSKSFEEETATLSSEYAKAFFDLIDDFEEMVEDNLLQEFEKRQTEIQKREVEVMCVMPRGLMSELNNLSGIQTHLQNLYQYMKEAEGQATAKKAPRQTATSAA